MNKIGTMFWTRDNKLIALAISFFLIWKFILIFMLWQDRLVPPEPDDSYSYISTIASSGVCKSGFFCNQYQNALVSDYSSYVQFSYKIILGTFAKILSISPESIYQISFYIGTVILAGIVFIFVRSLTKNAVLISLGIFFLALCHGNGEVHGFFWVVPSFFSASLFLLITALIIREDFPKRFFYILSTLLTPIFILAHPTSVYFLSVIIIYVAIYSILNKKIDKSLLARLFFILIISAITVYSQSLIMIKNGQGDPYGITSALQNITSAFTQLNDNNNAKTISYNITANETAGDNNSESYFSNRVNTMRSAYFAWFFPHWIIIAPFFAMLFLLYRNNQHKILSLYAATTIFFIVSTISNQFGFRAAILLWPITYLIYAFGMYYFALFIWGLSRKNQPIRTVGLTIILIGFSVFGLLNALYAITVNTNLNIRNNYAIDKKFERYLLENTSPHDTIYMQRMIRQSIFGSDLFFRNKIVPPQEKPTYIVILEQKSYKENPVNESGRFFINTALKFFGKQPLQAIQKQEDRTSIVPDGYVLEKSFADISIYRHGNI